MLSVTAASLESAEHDRGRPTAPAGSTAFGVWRMAECVSSAAVGGRLESRRYVRDRYFSSRTGQRRAAARPTTRPPAARLSAIGYPARPATAPQLGRATLR